MSEYPYVEQVVFTHRKEPWKGFPSNAAQQGKCPLCGGPLTRSAKEQVTWCRDCGIPVKGHLP